MAASTTSSLSLLDELDARQNEILDQLEKLNAQIERVLKESLPRNEELQLAGVE